MKAQHFLIPALATLALLSACASQPTASQTTAPADMPEGVHHRATESDTAFIKSTEPLPAGSALLWVNGLGCPLCATNVDKQLVRVEGVQSVSVDMSNGTVLLGLSGKSRPSPARLADAVADAGFTLVKVETR